MQSSRVELIDALMTVKNICRLHSIANKIVMNTCGIANLPY
jgi:hypothetical protein